MIGSGLKNVSLFFAIAALVCFVLIPTGSWVSVKAAEEEHVLTLTKDNFDDVLSKNDIVLVKFYAPWCGHCKKIAPEYEMAAKMLATKGSSVKLAKVDATVDSELSDKFGVRGYPTLQLFRKNVPEEYNGGRTADTIVEYIEKVTGPAIVFMEGDIMKKLEEEKVSTAFIGRFKSKDSEAFKIFEKVADVSRQSGRFVANIEAGHKDTIHVARYEEEEILYDGKMDEEPLKTFIANEKFPFFGPINGENFKNYADRNQDLVWFCGSEKEYKNAKKPVQGAAKKYRNEYSFVWLDTDEFKGHAENALGVTEFPALVYQSKRGRFILPDNKMLEDSEKIITFFEDVKANKYERSLKSESIPEKNDEPVKIVVGKNFESTVFRNDADVLLEVYAPWCGHCKKLEPIYKELGEKLKGVEHIVIAKMDGVANESPSDEFSWTGFPTLFFLKAGQRSPMKFEGERTLDGMVEYLKQHATKSFDVEVTAKVDKSEEL